jgi:Tol biopolymer transport system component
VLVGLPSLTQEDLTSCSMPNESGIIDWSPNGKSFLYIDKANGAQSTSIWLFDLVTKEKTQLTFENDAKRFDSRPRFASNGQDIAFIRGTDSIRQLYKTSLSNTKKVEQLTTSNSIILSHQWMDNDNYIIFDSNKRGDKNLWLLKVSNKSLVNLGIKDGQFPSVSNSNKLLFQEKKYQANLWRIDTSSQKESVIVESAKFDTNPSFSPDGKSFAFVSNRHGMSEIWQYNVQDAQEKRLLSVKNATLTYPMWHANKNKLLVSALDNKGYYCLEFDIDEQKIRNLVKRSTQISRCSYGLNNQIYAITKKANETQKLVMVRKKKIEEITDYDVSSFKVLASGDILYTKAVDDGIYHLTVHDGHSVSILPNFPNYLSEHWTVNKDNLIFVESDEQKKGIWKLNLETNAQTQLSKLVPNTIGSSLAISPDEKQLVITRLDKVESDIYLSKQ